MLYAEVYFGYNINIEVFLSELQKEINGLVTPKHTRVHFSNEIFRYMKMHFIEEYEKGQSIPAF